MASFHSQAQLPLLEGSSCQNQPHLIPFFPTHDPSPYPYPFSFHSSPEGSSADHHLQHEADINFQYGRRGDPLIYLVSLPTAAEKPCDDLGKKYSNGESSCEARKTEPPKWMSSKMRLMKKMMSSDNKAVIVRKPRRSAAPPSEQQQSKDDSSSSCSSNGAAAVRVCSDCNTTKTPLWRSGPQGPKSLCNACGIRQRKARKAMAEAAATINPRSILPPTKEEVEGEKGSLEAGVVPAAIVPYKKRCKFAGACDDLTLSSSESSALQRVFPQDEKEAAILLMALSCSLKF